MKPTPEAVSVSFLVLTEHEFYHQALGVLCSQGIYTWGPKKQNGTAEGMDESRLRDKWKPA